MSSGHSRGGLLTAEGHPCSIFRRAIERKNLLVALTAELDPSRLDAYGRRFLARLAVERPLTLDELDVAVTALRALPSARAADVLRQLVR